jgi:hypothetical protein
MGIPVQKKVGGSVMAYKVYNNIFWDSIGTGAHKANNTII